MTTLTIMFQRRHVIAGQKQRQIVIKAQLPAEEAKWLLELWRHGGDMINLMQVGKTRVVVNFKGVKKPSPSASSKKGKRK